MDVSKTEKLTVFQPVLRLWIVFVIFIFITGILLFLYGNFPHPLKYVLLAMNIIFFIVFTFLCSSAGKLISHKTRETYEIKLHKVQRELEDNMEKLAREKEKMEATYKEMEDNSKVLIKTDFELTKVNRLLDEKVKGLFTLHEIGTWISSAQTLQGILKTISEAIVSNLGYNRSLVILIKSGEKDFFIHRGVGFSLKNLNKFEQQVESGVILYSVVKGEPLLVNNLASVPPEFHPYIKALDVKNFIEMPLKVKGEVIGSLIAGKDDYYDEPLQEKDCELLSILAGQAAAAIETARSTEAIIQAKNQIEAIINSIIDGIVVTDSYGKVILINPAFERIFRVSPEEMKDKLLEDVIDNEYLVELFNKKLSLDEEAISEEIELSSLLERAPRILKASVSRVMNEKKEELGKVTLLRDITYEKEVDRMKSEFISTVSHELRTPLTSIKSFAEILLTYDEDKETQKEFLTIINDESERLTRLINDVLDISKIEAGRIEWKSEESDIEELIVNAVNSTSALISKKNLQVELKIENDLPKVMVDRDKIIQVITNLLSNAIKFCQENQIININTCYKDGSLYVSVRDSGRGIAPENHEKIFLKFCQIEDTATGKPDGTGLGLPICKEIIKYHRGRIWVESDLGKGSNFTFTIPVKHTVMEMPLPPGIISDDDKDTSKGPVKGTKLIRLAKKGG
jgi:PAS domain S-box-containing protein